MVVRELRNNPGWNKIPIGFIDDDPLKKGRMIQGLPVFGSREELIEILREQRIDDVLVSTKKLEDPDLSELRKLCVDSNVGLFTAYLSIEPVGDGRLS